MQGPSNCNIEINKQITVCETRDLCVLINENAAEFNQVNVAMAFRKLLQSRRDGVPSKDVEQALLELEETVLLTINVFKPQQLGNTMHVMAKAHYTPTNPLVLEALEQQAESVVGTFNAQNMVNTLWAYATMGLTQVNEPRDSKTPNHQRVKRFEFPAGIFRRSRTKPPEICNASHCCSASSALQNPRV